MGDCFTVATSTTTMPDFVGYPVHPHLNYSDTPTLDAYIKSTAETSPEYIAWFQGYFGCPTWNGRGQQFHETYFQGVLINMAQTTDGCIASGPQFSKMICQSSCTRAHDSLATIFSTCAGSDPDYHRDTTLAQYASNCALLPANTADCIVAIQAEASQCGFPNANDFKDFCSPGGPGATSNDPCCSSYKATATTAIVTSGITINSTAAVSNMLSSTIILSNSNSTFNSNAKPVKLNTVVISVVGVAGFLFLLYIILYSIYLCRLRIKETEHAQLDSDSQHQIFAKRSMSVSATAESLLLSEVVVQSSFVQKEMKSTAYDEDSDETPMPNALENNDKIDGIYVSPESSSNHRPRKASKSRVIVIPPPPSMSPNSGIEDLRATEPVAATTVFVYPGAGELTEPLDNMLPGPNEIGVVASEFDASLRDELILKVGDYVQVKVVYSDGWAHGAISDDDGTVRVGAFPLSCLRKLNSADQDPAAEIIKTDNDSVSVKSSKQSSIALSYRNSRRQSLKLVL